MASIPMNLTRNPYTILGARPGAELKEIQTAFRRRVREVHPDINPSPTADRDLKEALQAWELLRDNSRREQLDGILAGLLRAQARKSDGNTGSRSQKSGGRRRSSVNPQPSDHSGRGRASGVRTRSTGIRLRSPTASQRARANKSSRKRLHMGDLYFSTPGSHKFEGTVRGNLVVHGGAVVELVGRIEGDLRVAGGDVQVEGWIEGNLLINSGSVVVIGRVDGNTVQCS